MHLLQQDLRVNDVLKSNALITDVEIIKATYAAIAPGFQPVGNIQSVPATVSASTNSRPEGENILSKANQLKIIHPHGQ